MRFEPREYQRAIIRHVVFRPRCAVWAGMGMGKTSSVLFALDYLKAKGEVGPDKPALVLAPLRVAASTWPDEAAKWSELRVRVVPVVGTAKARKKALTERADIYCTNYETIPWLVEQFADWPFATIVADESTRLKGFRLGGGGGQRTRALGRVAFERARRFIELTGTPSPNGLIDLWGQSWFLDRGERLGRSFRAFTGQFFREVRLGADRFAVRYEPCEWAQEAIQKRLSDLCLSVRAEDYFPLDKPILSRLEVDLPPHARDVYDAIERDMFADLGNGVEVDAVSAAARTVKCLQVASGAVYDESGEWTELHDEKIDALKSVVEEAAGAPILVAYHWRADLVRLLRAFPQARALDKNPATIREWNAGRIPILLAHPASAGHGLNLQDGGQRLVVFSHWWDLEQYQQIIERIGPTRQLQAGHPRPVFITHIVARDTVDDLVCLRRESKRSVQDILLAAMRAKT